MKYSVYLILLAIIYMPARAQQEACSNKKNLMLKSGNIIELAPTINQSSPGGSMPVLPGDRIVYWVHGLGGSPESWYQAGTWVQENYKVRSLYPTYFGISLPTAGTSLGQSIDNLGDPLNLALQIPIPNFNFVVAHSQGGLVTRSLEKQYSDNNLPLAQRKFGGLVTFGTPHQGAKLAENIPSLKNYLAHGIYTLARAPILELMLENWLLNFVIDASNLDTMISKFAQSFPNQILPVLYGDFAQKITEDYQTNAAELDNLNSHPAQVHSVAIAGIETEPVLWRFIHSMTIDPLTVPVFGENDDDNLIPLANQSYLAAKTKEMHYANLYLEQVNDGCTWWQWIMSPYLCTGLYCIDDLLDIDDYLGYGENSVKEVRDAYADVANWWWNSNFTYKSFVGCYHNVSYVHPVHYICECEYFDNGTEVIDINYQSISTPCENQNFPNAICTALPIIISNSWEEASDGVVTLSSATAFPSSYDAVQVILNGSNHQQMKNDNNTKLTLISLLNGNFGNYFRTLGRN